MDWKKFQNDVAQIFRLSGCIVYEDARVKGARSEYNVDVLVIFYHHGFKIMWILECKFWRRNIPRERILMMKSIVDDVGADKGVVVCWDENGFQSGAIEFAKNINIELVSFRDLEKIVDSDMDSVNK